MYFKDCNELNIDQFLNKKYKFYAHIDENDSKKEKETLKEHTDRTQYYFELIFKNKKLEDAFLKIENTFFDGYSENLSKIFREMLINTVILHDIGKLNPLFQSQKMKNKIIKDKTTLEKYQNVITSKHSLISSTVYLDYYYNYIKTEYKDLTKEEKQIARLFMALNSHIISRHHSDLGDFESYMSNLNKKRDSKILAINKLIRDEDIDLFNKYGVGLNQKKLDTIKKSVDSALKNIPKEKAICLFIYQRLVYSMLVASDYYATSEYINDVKIASVGQIDDIKEIYDVFKNTDINKKIEKYKNINFNQNEEKSFENVDINVLRSEIFIESEKSLVGNNNENIYYFEAPTGSGKTNSSLNLSYKLFELNKNLNKIFYVYPFNTLVEQTTKSLDNTFGNNKKVYEKIAVINSITPIKQKSKDKTKDQSDDKAGNQDEYEDSDYQKFLLDRQFLNYPIVLTTHVSLFDTMFGDRRESCFGFYQLPNSVIVLDEIQSYKNSIWTEIITFLNGFAKILNIKVIIMSATLPDLNKLLDCDEKTTTLIKNRDKYFLNPLFKDRVEARYDLLDQEFDEDVLFDHVLESMKLKKKILIEFITKKSAYAFYQRLKEEMEFGDNDNALIELMTGDDSIYERNRILGMIKSEKAEQDGIILVATQVIEAGVDIDMDIGYKDISILENEEQFMGRINRSCKRHGIVYFFNLDNHNKIYGDDYRHNNEFTLLKSENREILQNKNFTDYYKRIFELLKRRNNELNENNIDDFFAKTVANLKSTEIKNRMQLIDDDDWSTTIYLCTTIHLEDGTIIDGKEVWDNYKELLKNNEMDYAKKQVKLSQIKSKMNYFIYQVRCSERPCYNDIIGEIYCIFDGEEYFKEGKLDREKFENNIGEFF